MKVCMLLFVITVFVSTKVSGQGIYGEIEEGCSKQGGQCILRSECEPNSVATKQNLCPKQQDLGYECCHGSPISETRCNKFGGQCFKKGLCKNPFTRAKDCPADQDCCILV